MEGFRVPPYGEPGNDWLGLDADYTAHVLLAPLAADLHNALRTQGFELERMRAGLAAIAKNLLSA